ncbi:hypothetical protein Tco_0076173, partial [Tanacetum coccineum]
HKELGDSLVRAATTASSLEAEQDNGNINKTQSKATPNESSSQGTNSGGGPRGNTLQSDEDRLKLDKLMALCISLQNRVLDLEQTKTTQHNEIVSLKRRVKKLEKKNSVHDHDVNVSADGEVFVAEQEVAKEVVGVIDTAKLIIDAAQDKMKSTKPKKKGIAIQELGESTTTISSQLSSQQSQDKGKWILIEHVKPVKKKDQISLDEETALNL